MIPPKPRSLPRFGALGLLVLALTSSVALAVPQADSSQPISLSLKEAHLPSVIESFARIAGGEIDIDPVIDGDVTVDWQSIPWKQALDRLCRTHRISCYWSEGRPSESAAESEPARLVVRRSEGFVGLAASISMELRKAPLRIVLQSMDSIAGEAFRVEVDPQVDGVIDVQLSSTPWPEALESICRPARCRLTWSPGAVLVEPADGALTAESSVAWKVVMDTPELEHRVAELLDAAGVDHLPYAELDALCEEAGCDWTLRWAETPQLVITAGDAPAPATGPKFGKEPIVLEASVSAAGFRTTRAFPFSWDAPSHRLEPAPDGDGPAVRLTWIPFSANQQVLFAFAVRCDDLGSGTGSDSGSGRYEVRPPVRLPLDGPWRASFGAAQIEVRTAVAATEEEPNAAPACADEPASFEMALRLEDQPAVKGMPGLPTWPGNFLMVTPKGEPGPAAALVYLGPNADGSKALALVRPTGDVGTDAASIQRFDLAPGDTWSRPVVSEWSARPTGMRMYVTVGPGDESGDESGGAGD